jgi:hypothetical protein
VTHIDAASPYVKAEEHTDGNGNARTWKFFVEKINTVWRRGAGDFIGCGQYLIQAKDELQSDANSAMLKKLHFDPSVAKKLSCIARNATLSAHVHRTLPTISDDRVIQGDILKCVDGHYSLRDGTAVPPDTRLLAIATGEGLQCWRGQTVDEIPKRPAEELPDVDALNGKVPRDQWEIGLDGHPHSAPSRKHADVLSRIFTTRFDGRIE